MRKEESMRLTVKDVAHISGISEATLRTGARKGKFPFMTAFKVSENNNQYTYIVFPEKVKEYFGNV